MKRVLIFALIMALIAVCFVSLCSAEEVTETAAVSGGISYSEKEQIVRDVLENLLEEGDELFAEREPWVVFSEWVRAHLGEIIAGVAGLVTLAGSLLVLLRTNPKFKKSIDEFKASCAGWFETISKGFTAIKQACSGVKETADKTAAEIEGLTKATLILVDALEDVIKLSGADEGKKEIYINKIEQAKAAVGSEKAASGDEK